MSKDGEPPQRRLPRMCKPASSSTDSAAPLTASLRTFLPASGRTCPLDGLAELVGPRTRVVAFPHVSNLIGEVVDARGAATVRRGVPTAVGGKGPHTALRSFCSPTRGATAPLPPLADTRRAGLPTHRCCLVRRR